MSWSKAQIKQFALEALSALLIVLQKGPLITSITHLFFYPFFLSHLMQNHQTCKVSYYPPPSKYQPSMRITSRNLSHTLVSIQVK